ncbi:MAG: murein L,D-transpeptidase YcbB/YkuD [Flavobacterium sp.]|jgi:murein L,D-transpeptidase YcbB/YkuD
MINKILSIFILLFFINCKNDKKLTSEVKLPLEDPITHTKIRPIDLDLIKKKNDSIQLYYKKFDEYEIWYNKENRADLINEIKFCYKEGLIPNDYNYEQIVELEKKRANMNDSEIFAYDISLTESFQKLATHLHCGKTNPKDIYENWDIPQKSIALSDVLFKAIKLRMIASTFKELKPQHTTYVSLKKSLIALNELPEYKLKKVYLKDKIEPNDTLNEIVQIKKHLIYWKDFRNRDSIITPVYDKNTVIAVKKFQKRHGLNPDGIIGQGTLKALNITQNERREQIYANLERWRWFPDNFGEEYLLINLPDYKLSYVVNNDTIAERRVVVGKPSRETPIISSKLSNFVFNPTWTVPPTIIKEDLTPSASKNRKYFDKNRISIYDSKGQIVLPDNWEPSKSKSYRYVQTSGYDNSLGLVKFNFPNRHSVYLHDTNHRDYFVREYRALSSGCVRIENPLQLSETILKKEDDKKWKNSEIDTIINKKQTKYIPIKKLNVNVYLFYWTSWSNKEGLQFREDIYNLDSKLFAALRN